MLFPPIHPTPGREAALDRQERPPQALDTRKRARQVQRVFLHRLRRFGQTAVWVDTHGLTPVALAKEVCIYLEGCMPSNSL